MIKLKNKTLIQRVITNALKVTPNAYVATDSDQIKDNINEISKNVIMTSSMHISGTDRFCDAANKLNLHENLNNQASDNFISSDNFNYFETIDKAFSHFLLNLSYKINSELFGEFILGS